VCVCVFWGGGKVIFDSTVRGRTTDVSPARTCLGEKEKKKTNEGGRKGGREGGREEGLQF